MTTTFAGIAIEDAVPEALIMNVVRQMLGDPRDTYTDVPGRAGSWAFPDKPGDRKITISINLAGDDHDEKRDQILQLADWMDSDGLEQLILDDEPDRFWLAKRSTAPVPAEGPSHADVDLEFRAGPYAFAVAASSEAYSAADGVAHPFTIDDTVEADPVIEIEATSGFTTLRLTVNGRVLTFGALLSGEIITVSTLAYMVTDGPDVDTDLVGYFDPDDVNMATVAGEFPVLAPGANSVTIDGGNADVTIRWRRRYR